ncbi:MAG: SDR family oxidoreductase [Phycisphaerae bacterium]
MTQNLTLNGKRAFVGGASQGIGRACAQELARLGAHITAVARDEAALGSLLAELPTEDGQQHALLVADFSNPEELAGLAAQTVEKHGAHEIIINNTGGPASGPLMDATASDIIDGITKHILAYQAMAGVFVPGMKNNGYGRIINIISTSVIMPISGLGVSNTTRGAVANWGRTLAGELGPFGITVNNVLPGFTATERLRSLLSRKAERQGTTLEAIELDSKAGIPMRRFADPREIGSVVAFLASPAASYVSGVNLPVDGARTAVQ